VWLLFGVCHLFAAIISARDFQDLQPAGGKEGSVRGGVRECVGFREAILVVRVRPPIGLGDADGEEQVPPTLRPGGNPGAKQ